MKTTFSRTFMAVAVILLTALLLVGVSFQLLSKHFLTDKVIDRLKNESRTIAQVAAAYSNDSTLTGKGFLINLSVASQISGSDFVLCDDRGKLLLCSDAPMGCAHQGLSITSRNYVEQLLQKDFVVSTGFVEGLYEDERYVVSTPIRDSASGRVLGIVIVSTPTADTVAMLDRLSDLYLIVSLLVVLAAVAVVTYYAKRTSSPLRGMAQTATAFGHGDLKARANVPAGSSEELQELALAFNNMACSLEQSETQRKEFVANVSHELKTPMTTISGFVDGILDGTIPAAQQKQYLQIVSQETKRLSRLVRSMLDISRLQEEGRIPEEKKLRFEICECAGQMLITFEQKINDKQLEVEVDMPDHPVYTYACQDYISQVIYNLLDNAVKFCPTGGRLGLQIRHSDKIYVSISNSGQTIPPDQLPLLFDRFHKLDKSRSENRDGWGLGLYIVRTLVCGHGENISVTSENGITEFTFTLPLIN